MAGAKKEIKVEVTFTLGYEKRFTAACLEILRKREARGEPIGLETKSTLRPA